MLTRMSRRTLPEIPMIRFPMTVTAVLLAGATLTGACGTRTMVKPTANVRSYAAVCSEGVAVYASFDSVPYDYYEVALISAEQNSVYTSKDKMVEDMRKRAGEAGGNGLVINSIQSSKATVKQLGEALGTKSADREGKAVAIYMPADSMRVKSACGTGG